MRCLSILVNMKYIITFLAFVLVGLNKVSAQCAMCKASVENSAAANADDVAEGFNKGIMLLMILPYVLFTGIVLLIWYNYRKKKSATTSS